MIPIPRTLRLKDQVSLPFAKTVPTHLRRRISMTHVRLRRLNATVRAGIPSRVKQKIQKIQPVHRQGNRRPRRWTNSAVPFRTNPSRHSRGETSSPTSTSFESCRRSANTRRIGISCWSNTNHRRSSRKP